MDELRARIAAALQRSDEDWQTYQDPYPDMADAVIAALDLRPRTLITQTGTTLRCYMSRWEPVNE